MKRIIPALCAGILLVSTAACSTSPEQAMGGMAGSLAGTVVGGAVVGDAVWGQPLGQPVAAALSADQQAAGPTATGTPGGPDYGPKKPHDHCGNGTMVHLGSVICSP